MDIRLEHTTIADVAHEVLTRAPQGIARQGPCGLADPLGSWRAVWSALSLL